MGNRKTLVIIAEGAIDKHLNAIKPEYVKSVLEEKLGLDTRVTTLGHVQRGGTPCAYDRYLATVQGVEAVEAVLRSTPDTPPPMIGMSQNKITNVPLMEAVKLTHEVSAAISQKDFKRAMELRDPDFTSAFDAYIESTLKATGPGAHLLPENKRLRIGIIHTGAPAGGMNAATRMAVRLCLNRGHVAVGIWNGFSGLIKDDVRPLDWQEVESWQTKGGSELGTNRDHPLPLSNDERKYAPKGSNFVECGVIAYHMQKHNIQALMIIGGFEAYTSLLALCRARSVFPAFCIPMVHLPATVSNNVPGTDFSLGSDTALNAIVEACDRIKLSANASRKRVFVVEVQGGNCGYLAVMGGLAVGATSIYIPEEGISISNLEKDIKHLCRRYHEDNENGVPSEGRLILRNEEVSKDTYPTEILSKILKAEGKGLFDSRTAILGHLQQGGIPSPLDRIRATRLAVNCIDWIQESVDQSISKPGFPSPYTIDPNHCAVIGIRGARTVFTSVEELLLETDVVKRRSKKELWWSGLPQLVRILAKYEYFDNQEPEKSKI
ncbi:6-phosphofructokinase, alpha subunit [Nowakowskiella sp. JEL0078]|nr:6-phosphofructokinase, alpha subunit [Nowakowskiella sp. JEL0078]